MSFVIVRRTKKERKKETDVNRSRKKYTRTNENKQTNKNTQLQNKITLKKNKQNFSLSHNRDKTKKHLFFFTQPKTYHLSHFIYILDNFSLMSFDTANLKVTMPQDKQ